MLFFDSFEDCDDIWLYFFLLGGYFEEDLIVELDNFIDNVLLVKAIHDRSCAWDLVLQEHQTIGL